MKIKFIGARGICSERAGTEKREKTPNGPKECDWPARARHREARARRSAVASIIQAQRGLTRRHWLTRRSLHLGESLDPSPCCLWGHPSAAFRAPKATQRLQTTNDRLENKKSFFFQQLCFPHHPFHTHWAVSMPAAPQSSRESVRFFLSAAFLFVSLRWLLAFCARLPSQRFGRIIKRLQTKWFDRHFDDVRADDYSFPAHKQSNVYNCISRPYSRKLLLFPLLMLALLVDGERLSDDHFGPMQLRPDLWTGSGWCEGVLFLLPLAPL
jgi:hypothetical protein